VTARTFPSDLHHGPRLVECYDCGATVDADDAWQTSSDLADRPWQCTTCAAEWALGYLLFGFRDLTRRDLACSILRAYVRQEREESERIARAELERKP